MSKIDIWLDFKNQVIQSRPDLEPFFNLVLDVINYKNVLPQADLSDDYLCFSVGFTEDKKFLLLECNNNPKEPKFYLFWCDDETGNYGDESAESIQDFKIIVDAHFGKGIQ